MQMRRFGGMGLVVRKVNGGERRECSSRSREEGLWVGGWGRIAPMEEEMRPERVLGVKIGGVPLGVGLGLGYWLKGVIFCPGERKLTTREA